MMTLLHDVHEQRGLLLTLLEERIMLVCSDLPAHVWLELEEAVRLSRLLSLSDRFAMDKAGAKQWWQLADTELNQAVVECEQLCCADSVKRHELTADIERRALALTKEAQGLLDNLALQI